MSERGGQEGRTWALLSYLAQLTTEPPAPLVVRLRPPERHDHVLIVGRADVLVVLVPLLALLVVPRLLALLAPAGHLAVANSWIWHEGPRTMQAAA